VTGIYLKCDKCGATYDGRRDDQNPQSPRQGPYHWSNEAALYRDAEAIGWTRPSAGVDLCPQCSQPKPRRAP
jgi:hypothetical protein